MSTLKLWATAIGVVLVLSWAPDAHADSPVTLTQGQAATVRYVNAHCNGCSSDAVAPASMCERHGPRVACDFAIWTKADTRQCDGRIVIKRVKGKLTTTLKGAMDCHATYTL